MGPPGEQGGVGEGGSDVDSAERGGEKMSDRGEHGPVPEVSPIHAGVQERAQVGFDFHDPLAHARGRLPNVLGRPLVERGVVEADVVEPPHEDQVGNLLAMLQQRVKGIHAPGEKRGDAGFGAGGSDHRTAPDEVHRAKRAIPAPVDLLDGREVREETRTDFAIDSQNAARCHRGKKHRGNKELRLSCQGIATALEVDIVPGGARLEADVETTALIRRLDRTDSPLVHG